MIYEKLNKRLPRKSSLQKIIKNALKYPDEPQEVRMASAKIKRKRDETNVLIFSEEDERELVDENLNPNNPRLDSENIEDVDERPDLSDSDNESFFSRDSNYVLEEWQLFENLEIINENEDEKTI